MNLCVSDNFIEDVETDLINLGIQDDLFYDTESDLIWYDENYEDCDCATGSSKMALIYSDVVAKIPVTKHMIPKYDEETDELLDEYDEEEAFDYCECELNNYHLAQEEDLDEAFAAEEYVGRINGVPVYIAEKAEKLNGYESSEETRSIVEKSISSSELNLELGNELWCVFVDYYGMEFCRRLSSFLDENDINDICWRNCGVIEGRPVFIDYSGYHG